MEIINIQLDKKQYVYGLDADIRLSFEIHGKPGEDIGDVHISYGADFHAEEIEKCTIFKDTVSDKNLHNNDDGVLHIAYLIPIHCFDFSSSKKKGILPLSFLKTGSLGNDHVGNIKNIITIEIDRGVFSKNISQKIYPQVSLSRKIYGEQFNIRDINIFDDSDIHLDMPVLYKGPYIDTEIEKKEIEFQSEKYEMGDTLKYSTDKIVLPKYFKGFISGWLLEKLKKNALGNDYVTKGFYENLKKKTILRIYYRLLESKIYNFFYKIAIIPTALFYFNHENPALNQYLVPYIGEYTLMYIGLGSSLLLLFSMVYTAVVYLIMDKLVYNYQLQPYTELQENIANKLGRGALLVSDIFKKFEIKSGFYPGNYNLQISLTLTITWTHKQGKNSTTERYDVMTVPLFKEIEKGYFNIHKVKLLKNNYKALVALFPDGKRTEPIFNKNIAYFSYRLDITFDSDSLPDIGSKVRISPKFKRGL